MMEYNQNMDNQIKSVVENSKVSNVYYLKLKNMEQNRSGHPEPDDHKKNARLLTEFISTIMKW